MKSKTSSRRSNRPGTCSAEQPEKPAQTGPVSLSALYQQRILAHNRDPAGYCRTVSSRWRATGDNPLCGDAITLGVELDRDGRCLQQIRFAGECCAICMASASMLCELLQGIDAKRAAALAGEMIAFIRDGAELGDRRLQPLAILAEVRRLPNRKTCATLPWSTLLQVLDHVAKRS